MKTNVAIVAALLAVAGCSEGVNGEMVAGRKESVLWFRTASPETIAAHFGKACESYGFQPGTREFSYCVQSEVQDGKSASISKYAAFSQGMSTATSSYSRPRNTTTTTNCNPDYIGGFRCTSY